VKLYCDSAVLEEEHEEVAAKKGIFDWQLTEDWSYTVQHLWPYGPQDL